MINKTQVLKDMILKFSVGFSLIAVILFLTSGTFKYWNAWIYLLSMTVPMILTGIFLYIKNPEVLEKRLKTNENEKEQKIYILISTCIFLTAFIIPGLDYRFGWSNISLTISIIFAMIMLFGYLLFVIVIIQNEYASRIIEIQKNQKVISTGLYSVVRHPMYLASIILFMATPIVLGSYYSFFIMLLYPVILILRINNEEKLLKENLEGYAEYMEKTKFRLVPFVW